MMISHRWLKQGSLGRYLDVFGYIRRHVAIDAVLTNGFAYSRMFATICWFMTLNASLGKKLQISAFKLMCIVAVGASHLFTILKTLALAKSR
jgi:hypothetical protein